MSNIAVLASGRGSNLEALLRAQRQGRLGPGRIRVVLSDNEGARALKVARDHDVEALHIAPGDSRDDHSRRLRDAVDERNVDLVVLAGFMRILAPAFIHAYQNRIINIHPSLLPAFPGLKAQRQALDRGVRIAGATTHFVDETVDGGPVILQAAVPVRTDDTEETLSQRILRVEHQLLPETVRLMAEGRLSVNGDQVEIKGDVRFGGDDALVPEVTP